MAKGSRKKNYEWPCSKKNPEKTWPLKKNGGFSKMNKSLMFYYIFFFVWLQGFPGLTPFGYQGGRLDLRNTGPTGSLQSWDLSSGTPGIRFWVLLHPLLTTSDSLSHSLCRQSSLHCFFVYFFLKNNQFSINQKIS